jgi:hypothetical protein
MPNGRSAESDARQIQVMELRRAGMRFTDIATKLDYADESGARKAYQAAMARFIGEPSDEMRRLHHERIEDLWRRAYNIAMNDDNKDRAMRALDRCTSLLERDSKLLGLDAPVKTDITITDTIDQQIQSLVAQLASRQPAS